MKIKLPRIVVAAVSSGGGKTTVVTGLLSALRQKGLKVQSYKVGPDYIDPGYHRLASGYPAHNPYRGWWSRHRLRCRRSGRPHYP